LKHLQYNLIHLEFEQLQKIFFCDFCDLFDNRFLFIRLLLVLLERGFFFLEGRFGIFLGLGIISGNVNIVGFFGEFSIMESICFVFTKSFGEFNSKADFIFLELIYHLIFTFVG
jgi:hypothetical protein